MAETLPPERPTPSIPHIILHDGNIKNADLLKIYASVVIIKGQLGAIQESCRKTSGRSLAQRKAFARRMILRRDALKYIRDLAVLSVGFSHTCNAIVGGTHTTIYYQALHLLAVLRLLMREAVDHFSDVDESNLTIANLAREHALQVFRISDLSLKAAVFQEELELYVKLRSLAHKRLLELSHAVRDTTNLPAIVTGRELTANAHIIKPRKRIHQVAFPESVTVPFIQDQTLASLEEFSSDKAKLEPPDRPWKVQRGQQQHPEQENAGEFRDAWEIFRRVCYQNPNMGTRVAKALKEHHDTWLEPLLAEFLRTHGSVIRQIKREFDKMPHLAELKRDLETAVFEVETVWIEELQKLGENQDALRLVYDQRLEDFGEMMNEVAGAFNDVVVPIDPDELLGFKDIHSAVICCERIHSTMRLVESIIAMEGHHIVDEM
jgi:hypothetical protein